ncbi:aspartyl-phosphate phosphatase Spo0E family protein [Salipaludibacillus sp. CUR1]|uniref:Stage 0 sporulation regulatory protein n=1 Tax=Salipaludibacillus aurantiacus TaxID=1601833 RepID=A0A1H9U6U0_9BACI|nr:MULTISPECIES: aspartyl-phosphate phosphatase Spo0E family protein [Salipaludibacillus]MCE7792785.1 aspartyl-phosphate phosphatase Spo0E family protein [Salipaludibacillus sp. CUR1]SES05196.1 stage 0 sporulation regulatory protein [Salipaludibacillus aurantiacus]
MLKEISEKREELMNLALKHGLNSEVTINCSQELDQLIIIFQKQYLASASL